MREGGTASIGYQTPVVRPVVRPGGLGLPSTCVVVVVFRGLVR